MADKEACSRIEQLSVFKLLFAEGCKAVEIHRRMSTVYGVTCFSRKNVYKWAKWFKERRKNVENEDRPGRPTEVKSPEVIKSVNDLIQSNRRVTVDDFCQDFQLICWESTALSSPLYSRPRPFIFSPVWSLERVHKWHEV